MVQSDKSILLKKDIRFFENRLGNIAISLDFGLTIFLPDGKNMAVNNSWTEIYEDDEDSNFIDLLSQEQLYHLNEIDIKETLNQQEEILYGLKLARYKEIKERTPVKRW